jgi:hypothetical protein|tara:strand:- start:1897 stop:2085 length:189 start_codon:yes stop_codon:yes gene_type:complete
MLSKNRVLQYVTKVLRSIGESLEDMRNNSNYSWYTNSYAKRSNNMETTSLKVATYEQKTESK